MGSREEGVRGSSKDNKNNLVIEVSTVFPFRHSKIIIKGQILPLCHKDFVSILARVAQILTPLTSGEFNDCVYKFL